MHLRHRASASPPACCGSRAASASTIYSNAAASSCSSSMAAITRCSSPSSAWCSRCCPARTARSCPAHESRTQIRPRRQRGLLQGGHRQDAGRMVQGARQTRRRRARPPRPERLAHDEQKVATPGGATTIVNEYEIARGDLAKDGKPKGYRHLPDQEHQGEPARTVSRRSRPPKRWTSGSARSMTLEPARRRTLAQCRRQSRHHQEGERRQEHPAHRRGRRAHAADAGRNQVRRRRRERATNAP